MGAGQPLQFYTGWFTAYVVVWMGFLVAISIYETRRWSLFPGRVLSVVAAICIGFASGEAAAFHIGIQAYEWATVAMGVVVLFALLLAPFYLRRPSQQEVAAGARRKAQAVHERLHVGADAVRFMECEFCRREMGG